MSDLEGFDPRPQYAISITPDPADLPTSLRKAAKVWQDAEENAAETEAAYAQARHQRDVIAPREDKETLLAAIRDGKGDPGTPATDKAAEAVKAAERVRWASRRVALDASRELAAAMRAHRADIVAHARPRITEALETYQETVKAHQAAAATLSRVTGWLSLVRDLDRDTWIGWRTENITSPNLDPATARITEALDNLDTPAPKKKVAVISVNNGLRLELALDQARAMVRSGAMRYENDEDAHDENYPLVDVLDKQAGVYRRV